MSEHISKAAWVRVVAERMELRTERHSDFYGEPGNEDPAHFALVEFSGDTEIDDDGETMVIVAESILLAAQAEIDRECEVTSEDILVYDRACDDCYDDNPELASHGTGECCIRRGLEAFLKARAKRDAA